MTKRRRLHEKPSDSKLSRKRRSAQTLFHDSTNHVATMTTSNAATKSPRSRVAFLTPTLRSVWLFSCGLRVAWTIYGQNGYIHPDEFFQGPEVVAGDVLGLKVKGLRDQLLTEQNLAHILLRFVLNIETIFPIP